MQIARRLLFTRGRIIVRGKLVTRGKAKRDDYIPLFIEDTGPLRGDYRLGTYGEW